MKKQATTVMATFMLIILCAVSFYACDNRSNESTVEQSEIVENTAKHYEIDLTTDNYNKYFNIESAGNVFSIKGVLGYAFYEDVEIEVTFVILSPEFTTSTYTTTKILNTNAAGEGKCTVTYTFDEIKNLLRVEGYFSSYSIQSSVSKIKGKVIFTA